LPRTGRFPTSQAVQTTRRRHLPQIAAHDAERWCGRSRKHHSSFRLGIPLSRPWPALALAVAFLARRRVCKDATTQERRRHPAALMVGAGRAVGRASSGKGERRGASRRRSQPVPGAGDLTEEALTAYQRMSDRPGRRGLPARKRPARGSSLAKYGDRSSVSRQTKHRRGRNPAGCAALGRRGEPQVVTFLAPRAGRPAADRGGSHQHVDPGRNKPRQISCVSRHDAVRCDSRSTSWSSSRATVRP